MANGLLGQSSIPLVQNNTTFGALKSLQVDLTSLECVTKSACPGLAPGKTRRFTKKFSVQTSFVAARQVDMSRTHFIIPGFC